MIIRQRSLLALVFFAATLAIPACAQEQPQDQLHTMSRQELDVVKVLLNQEKAWNAGRIDEYASAYKDSPDTLFVADVVTRGFASMLTDFHHNYATKEAMGTLTFSHLEPKILDEHFSALIGRYHLERGKKQGGPADGVFSLVLEKTEGGWKIVLDHRT
jgi:ketosteroid isomerase-like protein